MDGHRSTIGFPGFPKMEYVTSSLSDGIVSPHSKCKSPLCERLHVLISTVVGDDALHLNVRRSSLRMIRCDCNVLNMLFKVCCFTDAGNDSKTRK